MFERFTDRARRIMATAKAEAERLQQFAIGTEHILLGLVHEEASVGAAALKAMRVDLGRVRLEVEKLVRGHPGVPPPTGNDLITPRGKKVLELALEEMTRFGHNYIGSEHLLLGLIRENEGIAANVLRSLGVTFEAARERVVELLRTRSDDRASAPALESHPLKDDEKKLHVDLNDLTERSKRVMELAKAEAKRLEHDVVGTQHILVGLIEEEGGVASNVFRSLHVELASVRASLDRIVVRRLGPIAAPGLPYTPRGKRVLELAAKEAAARASKGIDTEHLLLGMLQEDQGIAARVLLNLGVKFETVRAKLFELLGERGKPVVVEGTPPTVAEARAYPYVRIVFAPGAGGETITIPPLAPKPSKLRIGVVGAGGIVRSAHLPGYRKWGLGVSAIVDVRREAAEGAAAQFEIPNVCSSVEELVARKDVDVLDVAIPEQARAAVVPLLLKAGKPVLLQKPLAYSLEDARRLVDAFAKAKVPLAVNQNLRWSPEMQAARFLIANGHLGRLFDLRWTMRNTSDRRAWAKGSWYSQDERFQVLSWSEHHLDAFRFLLDDEGARIYCALPRRPDQNFKGDVAATAVIHFKGGVHVSMVDSNVATPGRPEEQTLDVDGTGGSLTLGLAKPRYFVYWLAKEIEGEADAPAHTPTLAGEWYPDGFAGSMASFLEALAGGGEAPTSGRRNLGTMALVDACYRSAASGQAVEVARIDG
jgi:predicted dehydrogenase